VACPLSIARGSQGTGSCVLAQVLGNRIFPLDYLSLLQPNNSDVKLRPNKSMPSSLTQGPWQKEASYFGGLSKW
jgi:hypothetical protein